MKNHVFGPKKFRLIFLDKFNAIFWENQQISSTFYFVFFAYLEGQIIKKTVLKNTTTGILNGLFGATHYQNYHGYRRAMRRLNFLLWIIGIFGIIGSLPFRFNQHGLLTSLCILLLAAYFFAYYWITAKARLLKRDSQMVKARLSFDGELSKEWNIYDGIYDDVDRQSLEIAFVNERSWLSNWIRLILRKRPVPFGPNDIDALQRYLIGLQQLSNDAMSYVAYGTMDQTMSRVLLENCIELREIDHYYLTKPGRWDYAFSVGDFRCGLWHYPAFKVYAMSMNASRYNKIQAGKFKQKKINKDIAAKIKNLDLK